MTNRIFEARGGSHFRAKGMCVPAVRGQWWQRPLRIARHLVLIPFAVMMMTLVFLSLPLLRMADRRWRD